MPNREKGRADFVTNTLICSVEQTWQNSFQQALFLQEEHSGDCKS